MPSWLGVGLAAAFTLVAVHRGVRRDVPGSLMAAGMAVMSAGMGGLGSVFVHGPWWAAGFAAVALWPLVSPHRADDLGYGAGLWWGALRRRTLAPLRPVLTGLGGQALFSRVAEKRTSRASTCAIRQHAEKQRRLR